MTYIATPKHGPSPDSNEIYNSGRPFLSNYCLICNLSDLCTSVDKERRGNIACSLHDHAQAEEPLPQGNSISNFGRLSLGHHYHTISSSDLCLIKEKKILKK